LAVFRGIISAKKIAVLPSYWSIAMLTSSYAGLAALTTIISIALGEFMDGGLPVAVEKF
jgi:hypothetical protein